MLRLPRLMATSSPPTVFLKRVRDFDHVDIPIRLARGSQRRTLLTATAYTCGARSETLTKTVLRALAREVARCRAELAHGSTEQRLTAGDVAEEELLKMFAGEDLGLLL
jgi:hypothetical protein